MAISATTTAVIAAGPAAADATTVSSDTLRTSWDSNEAGLSPSAVTSPDFGRLFSTAVNGQVYASPIVANGTLFAATENDNIYGMDPATGALRWSRNVGAAWPVATIGCGDLTPNIGITSTPVYDPASGFVYFTSKVNDGVDAAHPHWYMHAVNPATGAERTEWPVTIQGTPSNDPTNAFNSETAMQRPGLLLLGGVVYAGFASHCDKGPYVGYVVGVSTTTPKLTTMWSTEAGSSHNEAGIWQSGGGLVSDGAGRIIVATGNGVSPAAGPGNTPPSTLAESVVRLGVNADGSLTAQSFFSPGDNAALDQSDADLGSGGPMAIPANFGTATHPHMVVQVGKDGRVFLLDADNLGGMAQAPNGRDLIIGKTGPFKGVWGSPAFWGGDGGYVYIVENGGNLRALHYSLDANGVPSLAAIGASAGTFGFGSSSPAITSSGSTSGSALVWVVYTPSPGSQAELRAYSPVPVNGVMNLVYTAPVGISAKFGKLTTDNGHVYLGTLDGHILGFGRPTTSPITGTLTDFGMVPVGTPQTASVTITAAKALTLSGVSTSAPFSVTQLSAPVTMAQGDQYTVPVTFTPSSPGAITGIISFATDSGAATLGLQGMGTQDGFSANPSPLDFGTVPSGSSKILTVNLTNTGNTSETISSVTPPSAPFSIQTLPSGTVAAGNSIAVTVTYSPTVAANDSSSLTVVSDKGTVVLPITGMSTSGSAILTVSPSTLNFGTFPIGTTALGKFTITNTGNTNLILSKAAPPTGVFNAVNPVPEGQLIAPGDVITVSITFSPNAVGFVTATYQITGTDGRGPQNVTFTGTGINDPIGVKNAQLLASGINLGYANGPAKAIGIGRFEVFQHGSIYWSTATGAHYINGVNLTTYKNAGGPAGQLGFLKTDPIANPGGGNHLDTANNGSIYYIAGPGSHFVIGAIRTKWVSLGAQASKYGYPTGNPVAITGGSKQVFQHGTLTLLNGVVT